MRFIKTKAVVAAAILSVSLAACGDDTESGSGGPEVEVEEDAEFDEGTTMADLNAAQEITIGVKIDQPGLGFQEAGADSPEGFDIEIARIIAAKLGIPEDGITWTETISNNREPFLENDTVDIVLATYSITTDRRKLVGQAGPYYVTGQQLMVRAEDEGSITGPDDLEGVKVCSVEGSTSLATVQDEYGADPVPQGTYSECVDALENGTTDVVTTDGSILLGYAAEDPDNLKVVGEPFSEENYGVGYKLGDTEMCEFITDTIQAAMDDDTWAAAFESTLGQSGVETPDPPTMDECL